VDRGGGGDLCDRRGSGVPAAAGDRPGRADAGAVYALSLVVRGFPIDEGRHGEIRRALAARDAAGLISDPHREQWLAEARAEGEAE
jgi:hypothetical protein